LHLLTAGIGTDRPFAALQRFRPLYEVLPTGFAVRVL